MSQKKSLIEKISEKFTERMQSAVMDFSPEEVLNIYRDILITELVKELKKGGKV